MKESIWLPRITVICSVILLILTGIGVIWSGKQRVVRPEDTRPPVTQSTESSTAPSDTAPGEVTEPTETEPTQPQQMRYVLSFVGDCTLGTDPNWAYYEKNFINLVGDNYDYPFMNVVEYFRNDDCTFANLESVLADDGIPAEKKFRFRGPTAYTQILTGSSVEAVTIANNHSYDFGQEGYDSTRAALENAGVYYAEDASYVLFTTESGLKIGLYSVYKAMDAQDMVRDVATMRQQGAEIIVASQHHGIEGSHQLTEYQKSCARQFIDAGVDIVWGHHPHVLQAIEEYNGGIIYYSLGNFSFGGNHGPDDMDTAILQQEIIREPDGSVHLGELTVIPCSISAEKYYNDFRPTPYEEGSEAYDRVLSKLDGTYVKPKPPTEPTEPTEPSTQPTEPPTEPTVPPTEPTEPTVPPTDPTEPTEPPVTEPPVTEPPVTEPPVTEPATEATEATEVTEATEATEATESTESTETTEATEATEETEETDATDPT